MDTKDLRSKLSNVYTKAKTGIGSSMKSHRRAYIGVGSGIAGAGLGVAIAKRNAKNKAAKLGLKPGTPEYKSFIRKAILRGGFIGGFAGGVASELGHGTAAGIKNKSVKAGLNTLKRPYVNTYVTTKASLIKKIADKKIKKAENDSKLTKIQKLNKIGSIEKNAADRRVKLFKHLVK
jgi:hypothetical protein